MPTVAGRRRSSSACTPAVACWIACGWTGRRLERCLARRFAAKFEDRRQSYTRHRIELWPRRPIAGDYQFTVAYSLVGKAANRPPRRGWRFRAWSIHGSGSCCRRKPATGRLPGKPMRCGPPFAGRHARRGERVRRRSTTRGRPLADAGPAAAGVTPYIPGRYPHCLGDRRFVPRRGRFSGRIRPVVGLPVSLPPGCRLIQAALGAVPLDPLPDSRPGMWRLPLEADRLPGRVEILFASRPGEATDPWLGRRQFAAPTLGDLPVRRPVGPSPRRPALARVYPRGQRYPTRPLRKATRGRKARAPRYEGSQRTTSDTGRIVAVVAGRPPCGVALPGRRASQLAHGTLWTGTRHLGRTLAGGCRLTSLGSRDWRALAVGDRPAWVHALAGCPGHCQRPRLVVLLLAERLRTGDHPGDDRFAPKNQREAKRSSADFADLRRFGERQRVRHQRSF